MGLVRVDIVSPSACPRPLHPGPTPETEAQHLDGLCSQPWLGYHDTPHQAAVRLLAQLLYSVPPYYPRVRRHHRVGHREARAAQES